MKKPVKAAENWCNAASAVKKIKKHATDLDMPLNHLLWKAGVNSSTFYRWQAGQFDLVKKELVDKILAVEA